MRRFVAKTLAVLSIVLSACAPRVVAEVQIFHDLDDRAGGETIAILPADDRRLGSLEFSAYASNLAEHLQANGFLVTRKTAQADFVAFLDYGIDGGQDVSRTRSRSTWGTTGVSTSSDGYVTPTYGITGYTTRTTTRTIYNRFVGIDIVRADQQDDRGGKSVYEARITSRGPCASLAEVIDEMLAAGFTEFPGANGRGRQVTMSGQSGC